MHGFRYGGLFTLRENCRCTYRNSSEVSRNHVLWDNSIWNTKRDSIMRLFSSNDSPILTHIFVTFQITLFVCKKRHLNHKAKCVFVWDLIKYTFWGRCSIFVYSLFVRGMKTRFCVQYGICNGEHWEVIYRAF